MTTRKISRRSFVIGTPVVLAGLSSIGRVKADPGSVRVLVGGGDWGKANVAAYVKPFEEKTGIKVVPVTDEIKQSQLALMVKTGNVAVDVIFRNQSGGLAAYNAGLLEDLDYSLFAKDDVEGLHPDIRKSWGVGMNMYSFVQGFNTEKFPDETKRPQNWTEFWDGKTFPGRRVFVTGQSGYQGMWEEALLADGIAPADIYPIDIDRVFKSLDKVKPYVRKWWHNGSEVQQLFRDKAADLGNTYDNRIRDLKIKGYPVDLSYSGAKTTWDYWMIPKGSPNAENARRFIAFACAAENQANLTKAYPIGPSNQMALLRLDDEYARSLPSHPDNLAKSVLVNAAWYSQTDASGKTNAEKLIERWNSWVLG